MAVCAHCGQDNPDGFRFCGSCGSPMAEAPRTEERKVVTVLFADLVGFTGRSERMDVEDVRGTLAPYHALLRDQLEHYGGTVEKFIGDAVMALFGAPVTHEDDPERAVRAGRPAEPRRPGRHRRSGGEHRDRRAAELCRGAHPWLQELREHPRRAGGPAAGG
jgi:class 3 adenylate cyclase